ncbi:major facilitator superfamily domain-containing protein [Pseudomassariella vexata]|uniref:Major facilitator superfamily domain-containing protein n=1 Tax=Pseudomassariella vexata TaxID=1141098 RepID=A0A1Y2EI98_9PEZI|nr:major facilitator superfamily domain-containing protein [Pseudomassariella vexata]ORY70956.1 major facilitator superfamily domain-containing protein [Pseudomassariella vexata]
MVNLFLYALDATTLAVATPAIAAKLGGTSLESFWASISYLLAVVATQPMYAALSDIFGRKPPLYVALLLFFAGSLVFALATNMGSVIAGRTLQGLGGGGLDVLSEIIVTDMTTLQERPLYLGLMAIPTAIGSVLGPTVGGLFSSLVTWRWLGWVNLPLLGISFTLTIFFLQLRPLKTSLSHKLGRLDWTGMSLFTIGSVLFVLPLSWADNLYAWESYRTILPLLLGTAILATFAVYERRPTAPIMLYRIFQSKTASATFIGVFFHGMSLYSLLQWLPLMYQAVMAQTVLQSAVTLLPTSFISVIGAVIGISVVGMANIGYRWSIRLSWILTTAGTGILVLLDAHSSTTFRTGPPVIWGAGIGLLLRLLVLPVQASVLHVDETGLAIGILLTFRLVGGLVGLAVCSIIFSSVFSRDIAALGMLPDSLLPLRDPNTAIAFIPTLRTLKLPEDTLLSIRQAYLTAIQPIYYAMTGFSGLCLLSSFFAKDLSMRKTEMGQQQFEG